MNRVHLNSFNDQEIDRVCSNVQLFKDKLSEERVKLH